MLPAAVLTGSALTDALSALGLAGAAVVRRLEPVAPTWHIIGMLARSQLLAPHRRG